MLKNRHKTDMNGIVENIFIFLNYIPLSHKLAQTIKNPSHVMYEGFFVIPTGLQVTNINT